MKKVNFNLRNPQSEKPTSILMRWSFDGQRLKYNTGEMVKPSDWNEKSQQVKRTVSGSLEINGLLDKCSDDLKRIYRTAKLNNEPVDAEYLTIKLDEIYKGRSTATDLFAFIDGFIDSVKSLRTKSTIDIYNNAKNHLKEYESYNSTKLSFDKITLDFYNQFSHYLIANKGFSTNTIAKIIKTLKTFMNEATERGLNKNLEFKSKRFKVITEETEAIYLNETELNLIHQLNLNSDERLERVRDLFLVGCYTGLRFSDLSQLKSENINGNIIKIRTQKTSELVVIPVSPQVQSILNKYNGSLPNAISNQKTNDYLKEIGKLANLIEMVEITENKGQMRIKNFVPKHELITTHTARRSFATNLYLQGFPTISIMKITGHRTEKAFMRYLKISQEQNAQLLSKFWNEKFNLKIA